MASPPASASAFAVAVAAGRFGRGATKREVLAVRTAALELLRFLLARPKVGLAACFDASANSFCATASATASASAAASSPEEAAHALYHSLVELVVQPVFSDALQIHILFLSRLPQYSQVKVYF